MFKGLAGKVEKSTFADVNDLALHIEYLLLHADCVIVEGLGGFVAQPKEAVRSEAEELFLPPVRVVRYNAALTHDCDHVLERSLCSIYKIGMEEASRRVANYAHRFQEMMDSEGTVDFGSLGVFNLENQHIVFNPCEAGVTTPDLYGLDTFHIAALKPEEMEEEVKTVNFSSIKSDDKQITIRLNRRIANYAATIAASVVMFVMFNTTLDKTTTKGPQTQTASIALPMPQQKAEALPDPMPAKAPKTVKATVKTQPAKANRYAVVLSSGIPTADAERFTKELKAKDVEAKVLRKGEMNYVVVDGFADKNSAVAYQRKVNSEGLVDGAWLLALE